MTRSGLALNHFVDVSAGVLEYDYTGFIYVCFLFFNHSEIDFVVNKEGKNAQFIFKIIAYPEVNESISLENTDKGTAGWFYMITI